MMQRLGQPGRCFFVLEVSTEQEAIRQAVISLVALGLSIPYVKPIAILLVIGWFIGWAASHGAGEATE